MQQRVSNDLQKQKQTLVDVFIVQKKHTESSLTSKSGSKELDAKIASFFYENTIPFNVADSRSFAPMIKEALKFRQQHPPQTLSFPLYENYLRKLSGEPLDQAYASTKEAANTVTADAAKYGAAIASGG